MNPSTKSKRTKQKLMLWLALCPPAVYIGLFAATPTPYSPMVDYAIMHSSAYAQEVYEGASLLEDSQKTLKRDVTYTSTHTFTSWTVPNPSQQ